MRALGYVHIVPDTFLCGHEKLSSIVLTPSCYQATPL